MIRNILIYIIVASSSIFASNDTILKIGLPDVPGLMYRKANGEPVGIPLEITRKAFEEENIRFEWVDGSWSKLYNKLKDGKIDVLPGMMVTDERKEIFDFTENSLYLIWSEIFIHKDFDYNSLQDFRNKKIGLIKYDNNSQGFIDYIDDFQIDYEKIWFESHKAAMTALKRKEIFGFAAPNPNILNAILLDDFKRAGLFFNPVNLSIAFAKGKNEDIRQKIDDRIATYKKDPNSELNRLIDFYRVSHITPNKPFFPEWLKISIIVALSLILISFLFIFILKIQINKKTKDLLIAKEKAEESERLKSQFLANMSHEIRTPLNAIVGFSSIITENQNSKEDINNYSEIIAKQSDILLNLINDIVDYAKIESNSLKYVFSSDVSIKELLDEAYQSFKNSVPQNINFTTDYDSNDIKIYTDRLRLLQIINNFISNALKHTSKGSVIIGFSLENNNQIKIFVKDEGEGIPIENQEKIFSRFYKKNEFSEGAGLGLTISKAIADNLGYEIGVESEPDKGSLFYIIIDLNKNSQE